MNRQQRKRADRAKRLADRRIKADPDKLQMAQAMKKLIRQRDRAISDLEAAFLAGQEDMRERAVGVVRAAITPGGGIVVAGTNRTLNIVAEAVEGLALRQGDDNGTEQDHGSDAAGDAVGARP